MGEHFGRSTSGSKSSVVIFPGFESFFTHTIRKIRIKSGCIIKKLLLEPLVLILKFNAVFDHPALNIGKALILYLKRMRF